MRWLKRLLDKCSHSCPQAIFENIVPLVEVINSTGMGLQVNLR